MSAPEWPANGEELRAAGYRPADPARRACESCGAPLVWVVTAAGRELPLEQVADVDDEVSRFRPHLARCLRLAARRRQEGRHGP